MKFSVLSTTAVISVIGTASSFVLSATTTATTTVLRSTSDAWSGEVVPNAGGKIQGCSIQSVGESGTEFIIQIDGVQADLGRFSQAIYRKITSDAKRQRFQGFRPGTIPPQLEPTYRSYAMDECARETVLEAMQQNGIRPFTNAREEFAIERVTVPPPTPPASGTKKNKKGKRKKGVAAAAASEEQEAEPEQAPEEPAWSEFENMKGAIDAGWKPGQSFSFVAKNVKGQKVLSKEDTEGAIPIGLNY